MILAAIVLGRGGDFLSTVVALEDDLIRESAPGLGPYPSAEKLYKVTCWQIICLTLGSLALWCFVPLIAAGVGITILVSGCALATGNNWLSIMITIGRLLASIVPGMLRPWWVEDFIRGHLMASMPENPLLTQGEPEALKCALDSLDPVKRARLRADLREWIRKEKEKRAHGLDYAERWHYAQSEIDRMKEQEYQTWLSLPAVLLGWLRLVVAAIVAYMVGAILVGVFDLSSFTGWKGALIATSWMIGGGLAASAIGIFFVTKGGWYVVFSPRSMYVVLDGLSRLFGGVLSPRVGRPAKRQDTERQQSEQGIHRQVDDANQQEKGEHPLAGEGVRQAGQAPRSGEGVSKPAEVSKQRPNTSQSADYWRFCVKCRRTQFSVQTSVQKQRWQAGLCPYCEGQLIDRETYRRRYGI